VFCCTCVVQWSAGVLLFTMVSGVLPFQYAKPGDWWFDRVRNNQMHLFWQAHFRTCAFPPQVVGECMHACASARA
jgi:hypothetical protein